MREISFIVISIFVLMFCNGSIYQAYGTCIDESKNKCTTNIIKNIGGQKVILRLGKVNKEDEMGCRSCRNPKS